MLFSQLLYDGHRSIASNLAVRVNADPSCFPSDQLMSIVTKGLQHETDRLKESDQADFNPVQQMMIGSGLGMHISLYTPYICVLNSLHDLIRFGI